MSRKSKRAKRKARQKQRAYQNIMRENAQLAGDIPTTPQGALRPEAVDPQTQEECADGLPELVKQALREGWDVKEDVKPVLVDQLVRMVKRRSEKTRDRIAAFVALRMADKDQYQRENPQSAGNQQSPVVLNINVVNVDDVDLKPHHPGLLETTPVSEE